MVCCSDPALGALLAIYEIGGLTEDELRQFEIHLMQCDYCLNEVRGNQQWAQILRHSRAGRRLIASLAQDESVSGSHGKLREYFWPSAPLIFRPAILIGLIALMIFPAWLGIKSLTQRPSEIRAVQTIRLTTARSGPNLIFRSDRGMDGVIDFAAPDQALDRPCEIRIVDDRGREVMHISAFSAFDSRGMGQIFFPRSHMRPGIYKFLLSYQDNEAGWRQQEYSFKIE